VKRWCLPVSYPMSEPPGTWVTEAAHPCPRHTSKGRPVSIVRGSEPAARERD
jgi:hypothetical protein